MARHRFVTQGQEKAERIRAISLEYAKRTPKPESPAKMDPEDEPFLSRYQRYLQSEHWRIFRLGIVAERGARCQRCGSTKRIQVHHKTYARLGRELPQDVEILCSDCHGIEHGHAVHSPLTKKQLRRKRQAEKTKSPYNPTPSRVKPGMKEEAQPLWMGEDREEIQQAEMPPLETEPLC